MSRLGIIDIFSRQKNREEDHSDVERFLNVMFGSETFISQRDPLGVLLTDDEGELSDEEMEWISAAGHKGLHNTKQIKNKDCFFDI